ncbi:MAG: MerR family transcriptional regulator [Chloroflexota bacterium]|nr:MerR family transcriptional regulator [Chloroflexota bacterium]
MPPTETTYTIHELASLADVTPRTVRYYISQGLLPSPGQIGPGARYGDVHLERLRAIKQLQRMHLPLSEIRARLAAVGESAVAGLGEQPQPKESAVEYVRSLLGPPLDASAAGPPAPPRPIPMARTLAATPVRPVEPSAAPSTPPQPDRSQWERVSLAPDVELHIRRPLSRLQNRRVDRLITIARELLEEDQR